ncbi:MAG: hypothetical protein M1485_01385 [Chloroflexi bacterium]|nr:hypothetical protein [Chloroflexota bacterium]MCL5611201.1 hypothetical protein [Chloroflexota bacterium]
MKILLDAIPFVAWTLLWIAGGWLLVASLFRLRGSENAMIGLGVGLVLQAWLANLLARALPVMTAFWLSAALVFLAGIICAFIFRRDLQIEFSLSQWLLLILLTLLFNFIGNGLGIFDDYQNLPTVSLMATGDIPPHFALNPSLNFGYHYLLLLISAEFMRMAHMFPWSALDLARGFILALPLMLAGLWAYRLTRNRTAAFLTSFMLAFAGGARWLLLLIPQPILNLISSNITLIGSASTTASNLSDALLSNWKIDGAGPIPFPFAFYTGINQPYIMAYTGIAGSAILIMLILLMTAGRWRHWSAAIITSMLIAALAIANEVSFGLIGLSFLLVILTWMIANRSWKLPRALWIWIAILSAAGLAALVQGGMFTEIVRARFQSGPEAASYFDASPSFVWPPSIISAHLGSLSIFNLSQLIAALAEIGPIILVTPLVLIWAWKSFRLGKWFEAALIASSLWSVPALFVAFKGPLFTATPRLMSGWLFACILYSVPLLWIWLRKRSGAWQVVALSGGLVTTFAGLILFGVQLVAIQKPIYTTFITPMDAQMSQSYWNKLRPDALIFDPTVYRAPTVFGRFTDSSPSWYQTSPEFQALASAPDPFKLRAAGFDYTYFDSDYWNNMTPAEQALFKNECVKQIAQTNGIHSEKDYRKDFRRLLDIRDCKQTP